MNGTALDHQLIRDYLTQLEVALLGLPTAQARELKDQIAAHLDDALPASADDQEVTATLSRLGRPADLAAEAKAAVIRTPGQAMAAGARRRWARVVRVRWRTKIIAGVTVMLLATGATYINVFRSAPLIQFGGSYTWWYTQDASRQVFTSAAGAQQITVPIRSGQRQGLAIGIENPSNFTETVLGPPTGINAPWDSPNGPLSPVQVGVSVFDRVIVNGGMTRDVAFTLVPASIPPHQYRLLRITWISDTCLQEGDGQSIDTLYLRVRVGWFTRTDVIPLGMAWALAGPSHGPDKQPGPNYNKCA